MSAQIRFQTLDVSRRRFLSRGAVLAAGAAMLGAAATAQPAAAASKMAQRTVNYQPNPRGNAHCDNCAQWQQPDACKLVDGKISPAGWCSIYAPKQ